MTCFTVKGEPFGNFAAVSCVISSVQRGREERISQVGLWEEASPYVTEMVLIRTCWKSHADSDHNLQTQECDLLSAAGVESNQEHVLRCYVRAILR